MQNKTIIKKALFAIAAVLFVLALGIGLTFRNEIKTMNSITKVDKYGFYTMEFTSDYGFDEFLKVGASSDKELIQFVIRKSLKGIPIDVPPPELGCTTFNAVTPKGDFIFGRNFDMNYSPGMLVHTRPANGYESISMVNLAFLGFKGDYMPDSIFNRTETLGTPYAPLDGINEKGLSVGILLVPDKPTNQTTKRIDITCTTAIRMLLDKAATVDEAVTLLKKYDMHDSANACYHYQIADADGKSVIVEYINNEMHLLTPKTSYQACTNFFQTPGAKYNLGIGQDRYNIVMTGLKGKNGVVTEKEGMNLLNAAKTLNFNYQKKGVIINTQWSAIYNNTKKSVDICIGQNYGKVYHYSVAH
ncbi:MAG: carcinine hydrolase/isopenicillin-N N-acyltransferase family protein [Acidobacteriota bacterium]